MNQYGPIPIPQDPAVIELLERIIGINEQLAYQNKLILQALTIPQMIVKRSDV